MKKLDGATCAKPRKQIIPLAAALQWRGGGYLFQRKYDGAFCRVSVASGATRAELLCEHVTPRSGMFATATDRALLAREPRGFLVALRLASLDGQDLLGVPNGAAWRELVRLLTPVGATGFSRVEKFSAAEIPPAGASDFSRRQNFEVAEIAACDSTLNSLPLILPECGNGGEFVEAVLAAGGEGVCAHDVHAPWGGMFAAVLLEQYRCTVARFNGGRQSVAIAFADGPHQGKPAGNVSLLGGKVDRVRQGSIIKVEGKRLTAAGLIREPRVCGDTPESWLVCY